MKLSFLLHTLHCLHLLHHPLSPAESSLHCELVEPHAVEFDSLPLLGSIEVQSEVVKVVVGKVSELVERQAEQEEEQIVLRGSTST